MYAANVTFFSVVRALKIPEKQSAFGDDPVSGPSVAPAGRCSLHQLLCLLPVVSGQRSSSPTMGRR